MLKFLLNNQTIDAADLPQGTTMLDFVRYHRHLVGTKSGCREGDCGACTVLVGELVGDGVRYRSMTSCLLPLANVGGKHIVTVEGINFNGERAMVNGQFIRENATLTIDRSSLLTPVQSAMVECNASQCGFCTVGFVMSLTGFCLENTSTT